MEHAATKYELPDGCAISSRGKACAETEAGTSRPDSCRLCANISGAASVEPLALGKRRGIGSNVRICLPNLEGEDPHSSS